MVHVCYREVIDRLNAEAVSISTLHFLLDSAFSFLRVSFIGHKAWRQYKLITKTVMPKTSQQYYQWSVVADIL